jgi:Arc/MetJ-type ribon-helix-helix transcriptional regulator
LYYMPTISVRISAEQKRRLAKHGNVSETIRDAVRRYLDDEESEAIFARLRALQRENDVKTTPDEIVRMIKEDRVRDSR